MSDLFDTPAIHHRRSIRLSDYDYSLAGLYFVTICVKNRQCLLGHIEQGQMVLNEAGDSPSGMGKIGRNPTGNCIA
ncbi:hypothetical protein QNI16_18280 [Cytophagaceae bacterium YF14B1]|uniref:Transposase n=1 Tax=Xanthocytophaga flava TaxID=3048013 RepID=A0AAE3QN73_9BACT|nr:hypothetical protein [Xanthocytophaga flavus]MDJ1482457.1 hypothetical protein [Xanthocytophaga flavus]